MHDLAYFLVQCDVERYHTCLVAEHITWLLRNEHYGPVDKALARLVAWPTSPELGLAILTATLPVKSRLPNRPAFLKSLDVDEDSLRGLR